MPEGREAFKLEAGATLGRGFYEMSSSHLRDF
jgi:hypothetical protein